MVLTTTTHMSPNHYEGRRGATPHIIGIHTMEAPEAGNTAEAVANYFGNRSVQASSHWCVDDNSRVRTVADENAAWTMPPLNDESLNIEMAGYASQTKGQWADVYSEETLDNAALCAAEWCHKYDIPIRRNTDQQIANKASGFVGHIDVNRVYHASDHTDPGPNFPWTEFLVKVRAHFDNMPNPSPPATPTPGKLDCSEVQRALRVTVDNAWGPETDKAGDALIKSWNEEFPYGVEFAQKVVGTYIDGAWGANSGRARYLTTKNVQLALINMRVLAPGHADGVWGQITEIAYDKAKKACHI